MGDKNPSRETTEAAIDALESYSRTMGRTDMTVGDALSFLRSQLGAEPEQPEQPEQTSEPTE